MHGLALDIWHPPPLPLMTLKCAVMLVLLDNASLEPREIWEAPFKAVFGRRTTPGPKSRDRGALAVSEFIRIAGRVWLHEAELAKPEAAAAAKVFPKCGYRFKGSTWGYRWPLANLRKVPRAMTSRWLAYLHPLSR